MIFIEAQYIEATLENPKPTNGLGLIYHLIEIWFIIVLVCGLTILDLKKILWTKKWANAQTSLWFDDPTFLDIICINKCN